MKKGSLQKVMAIILSVTMITGMLMVDTALAMDGFILGDDSENRLVDDTEATAEPSAPQSSTLDPSGADTTEDFTSIIPATNAPLGALSGLAEMGGGLTISVTSSQTEVNDGDQYSFTVAIADSDLTTEPNIKPGDELTIKIPEFLSSDDLDAALKNCFAYFEKDYAFDEDTHTLKLRFKENSEGTWANI